SAYLLLSNEPSACSTAGLAMFSEGINSSVYCWRSNSSRIAAPTSGSTRSMRLVRSVRACSIGSLSPNQFGCRNRAFAQDPRRRAAHIENRRGLSDLAEASVEDEIERLTQPGDDLVGIDGRRAACRVGAAAGDRFAQRAQQ